MYQVCTKSVPEGMNPFASLTITYLVGAAASAVFYMITNPGGKLFKEIGKINWAPFVLGFVIVGLEVGFIYAYRAGWQISTAQIVQSSVLAVALIFLGFLVYHEDLTWNKLVGVGVCLVGLIIINLSPLSLYGGYHHERRMPDLRCTA
jgi:drug/metabolite transporter (DMT)-like permease